MRAYIKSMLTSALTSISYIWSTVSYIIWHTRYLAIIVMVYLANEHILWAISLFWDYLVVNSFCPWLMIFRGRPSYAIIIEASSHITALLSSTSFNDATNPAILLFYSAAELIGGPALGVTLTVAFVFISYKCLALIFAKLLNRKQS